MISQRELYRFTDGTTTYYLTSADEKYVYSGQIYEPTTIRRSEVETKNELSRANLDVTMSIDNAVARTWLEQVVDNVVGLTVFGVDELGAVSVIWKGRLSSVKPTQSEIVLTYESIFTSMRRPGLRRRFQRSCPHVHYGNGCELNKDDWGVDAVVDSIDGKAIAYTPSVSKPDTYYVGGMIKTSLGILRYITGGGFNAIELIRPVQSLAVGQTITLYPGCDRTRATCENTFDNLANNGSTPFIPFKNPFGGVSFL